MSTPSVPDLPNSDAERRAWGGAHAALSGAEIEILDTIAAGTEFATVAGLLCRRVAERAPGLACAVALWSDSFTLLVPAGSGVPTAYLRALDGVAVRIAPVADSVGPLPGHLPNHLPNQLPNQLPNYLIDTDITPGWEAFRSVPMPPGVAACWAVPIVSGGARPTGAFLVFLAERRALQATEQELVASSCRLGALAIGQHLLRTELERTKQLLEFGLHTVSDGVCCFDASERLLFANRRLAEIFGLRPEQVRPGMRLNELNALRAASGSGPAMPQEHHLDWRDALRLDEDRSQNFVELANGRVLIVRRRELPGGGWLASHQDITDRRQAESRIAHMARHDPLTGLANTLLFRERIEQTLALSSREQCHAVLCVDLSRLKPVNDALGRSVGDELLQAVAGRLLGCVRGLDTVTRLGGDTFGIFAVGLAHKDQARDIAQRVVSALTAPYQVSGTLVQIAASAGAALFPADGSTPEDLLQNAEVALSCAKAEQRGTYRIFEPDMEAVQRARTKREHELRRALSLGQFELYYQPLIRLDRGTITAFEALLRWRHPERGLVAPGEFIPLAEETGLIIPLGAWALEQACREAARWPAEVTVSVNLSPLQFKDPALISSVCNALTGSGLAPSRLELEITETVLLENSAGTLRQLRELHDLGVRISMDDFGTGHSSLTYLRSFHFDKLKIDQCFIREVAARTDALAIVRAIVSLGHSLDIVTTAEGVETQEQLALVREEGCDQVQGFLFSKPVPAAEVANMLRSPQPFAAAQTA